MSSAQRQNRFAKTVESRGTRTPDAPDTEESKPRSKAKKRGEKAKRTEPVRMTIDLDPPAYSQMRRVLLDVADAADRPTLTSAAMWRATLEELAEDPRLVAKVAKRIAAVKEDS